MIQVKYVVPLKQIYATYGGVAWRPIVWRGRQRATRRSGWRAGQPRMPTGQNFALRTASSGPAVRSGQWLQCSVPARVTKSFWPYIRTGRVLPSLHSTWPQLPSYWGCSGHSARVLKPVTL